MVRCQGLTLARFGRGTPGIPWLTLQTDGNLVLNRGRSQEGSEGKTPERIMGYPSAWSSSTNREHTAPLTLVLTAPGDLQIVDGAGRPFWTYPIGSLLRGCYATGTHTLVFTRPRPKPLVFFEGPEHGTPEDQSEGTCSVSCRSALCLTLTTLRSTPSTLRITPTAPCSTPSTLCSTPTPR